MRRLATIVGVALTLLPTWAHAQQRFGIEIQAGQNIGLTSYKQNIIVVEDSTVTDINGEQEYQPYLANEETNWGGHLVARLLINDFEVSLSGQWYTRDRLTIHHKGQQTLPRNRRRPDGSFDDSGVDYIKLETPRVREAPSRGRGNLFVATASGGYRWTFYDALFQMYVPVGLGVSLVSIQEDSQPLLLGGQLHAGLGASYKLSENLALSASARLHGLLSFHYGDVSDAARRAQQVNEGTEEALFSSMWSTSGMVGIVYIIR